MRAGIDLGCGWIKGVSAGRQVKFPSLVAIGRQRALVSDSQSALDQLEVVIDGEHYFTGELARREGLDVAASVDRDLAGAAYTKVKMLTALHLLADQTHMAAQVVTGLCINDFVSQKGPLAQALRGYHKVTVNGETRYIEVTDVAVFAQAAGALWGLLLNDRGELHNTRLARGKLGIVDIGYKDCNFAVLDQMAYVDSQSGSRPWGMHQCHLAIIKELRRLGYDMELHQLDTFLQRPVADQPQVRRIVQAEYAALAGRIIQLLAQTWKSNDFDALYVAGGGAVPLYDCIQGRYPNAVVLDEPQWANAIGFGRLAKAKFDS